MRERERVKWYFKGTDNALIDESSANNSSCHSARFYIIKIHMGNFGTFY